MNFRRVKKNYDSELWDIDMVANAITYGVITEEQFKEITGMTYENYKKWKGEE